MGVVSRIINPTSPVWITPAVLGGFLTVFLGYTLYTYKKELPLPPALPGSVAQFGAPAPRHINNAPDDRVYFFFTKVDDAGFSNLYGLSKISQGDPVVLKNLLILLALGVIVSLVITEISLISMHYLAKPLPFTQNTGVDVAASLTIVILLTLLFYTLRDSSLTPILYVLSFAFLMVLGAVISSQTQVNVQ